MEKIRIKIVHALGIITVSRWEGLGVWFKMLKGVAGYDAQAASSRKSLSSFCASGFLGVAVAVQTQGNVNITCVLSSLCLRVITHGIVRFQGLKVMQKGNWNHTIRLSMPLLKVVAVKPRQVPSLLSSHSGTYGLTNWRQVVQRVQSI